MESSIAEIEAKKNVISELLNLDGLYATDKVTSGEFFKLEYNGLIDKLVKEIQGD